ncbi:MAG TPA: copper chaperone PCu(A)C [Dongiaceae bacterium]
MTRLRTVAFACATLMLSSWSVFADDIKIGDLVIRQVWSRATTSSGANGAIYLEVDNNGSIADRLVAVASPVAAMAHLHTTEMQGDMASMKTMTGLDIPAGAKVILKPQANHIMLMGLSQQLKPGGNFPLTLQFEKAGKIEVQVAVEAAGALGPSGN